MSLELLYCQYEKLGYFCLGFIRLYKFVALLLHNFEVLGCTECCIYIFNTKLLIQIFILLVLGIWLLIRSTSFGIYFELLGNWFPGKLVLRLEWKIDFFLLWGQFQFNKFMAGGGNGSF